MIGPIGLHGGGEYAPGDEPFLRLLLEAAVRSADARADACRPASADDAAPVDAVRIAIVPTAAARYDPGRAGLHGCEAFERLAAHERRHVRAEMVAVLDAASASSGELAGRLAGADLVHFPGGDPGVVAAVLGGTLAWRAILAARARGAVVAGASAGAMALADWTWTEDGPRPGLGLVHGVVVVPHFDRVPESRWRAEIAASAAVPGSERLGILGLDEQTGVLSTEAASDGSLRFRVAGAGRAVWLAAGAIAEPPAVWRDGAVFALPSGAVAAGS